MPIGASVLYSAAQRRQCQWGGIFRVKGLPGEVDYGSSTTGGSVILRVVVDTMPPRSTSDNYMSTKKSNWSQVKAVLAQQEHKDLLKLVGDLYRLSKDNRVFIESRFLAGEDALEHYKHVISDAVYPDIERGKPVRFSVGKKAISDYKKATNDTVGTLELMVHYLEQGNQFTVDYGDIDEQFYASLESMFDHILKALDKESVNLQERLVPRLEAVVKAARHMGWGYYDCISVMLSDFQAGSDD